MGEGSGVYRVLVGKPERHQWGDSGAGGRIILRWIFRKWDVGVWTGLSWLMIETGGGLLAVSKYSNNYVCFLCVVYFYMTYSTSY
jgi:hypothetical protein